MDGQYYVYIMTNKWNSVLYTGVTSDLGRRVYEHKEKRIEGFTKRYNVSKLVYYEIFENVEQAISERSRSRLVREERRSH